jgi:hypothetical protein
MSKDLLNILSDSNKDIDNQLLMDYLAGKLSASQQHEVEKMMAEADSDFMNDAMEGLEQVKDKKDLGSIVDQLNGSLHKKLESKKALKEKRRIKDSPWTYLAIVLIIVLIVISYLIIHKLIKG